MNQVNIQKVVVIGTGTMGSGIAYVTALAGYHVTVVDQSQELLDKGMQRLIDKIASGIDRGKLDHREAEKVRNSINSSLNISVAVQNCHMVIEAVFEDMQVKEAIFKELNDHAPHNAILASNTSMLSITEMASQVKNPERVIGTHFFNPPEAMKLVEIVLGEETTDYTKDQIISFVKKIGKDYIITKDTPGFVVNRISVPVLIEALRVIDAGIASKEDVDKAMTLGMNYPIGPIALADVVGLDVSLAAIKTLEEEFGECYKPSETLVKLVEEGKLGRKTGEGFFKYD